MGGLVAPSILSADFARLEDAVLLLESAGADLVHIDIMDGHFVPNLTFGPRLVARLKEATSLPFDVHLMVNRPADIVPWFIEAGADWISIHAEASPNLHRDVRVIKAAGRKAGVALNPGTPLGELDEILPELDYVLLMCVNPGRGSQPFIPFSRDKIRDLRRRLDAEGRTTLIEIDGGVNLENTAGLAADGADVFVAGNAIFNSPDPAAAVRRMKTLASKGGPA